MSAISPGRPSELPDDTITKLQILYKHNVPATVAANQFQLSRQRVYYYFKKFYQDNVARLPKPSIHDILQLEGESLNG